MVDVADVATRCQAVDVARKISTVWRTVATGERWLWENGGYGRMVDVADVATRCQAVDVARKISTVWRTVATGKRWMWLM
jgi:L-lactate permease